MSRDHISTITDRVMEYQAEWQSRPLDAVYPVGFVDCPLVKIRDGQVANRPETDGTSSGHHRLPFRRSPSTGEVAYYRCWSPTPTSLPALTWAAHRRGQARPE